MATVVLFHSVLGPRPGFHDAVATLRAAGHAVEPVDVYDGRVFDDYREAIAFAGTIGEDELMRRALAAVAPVDDGFVVGGFSAGGGMAEYVATRRAVAGVLLFAEAVPVEYLGVDAWPANVPVQIHFSVGDPWRHDEGIAGLSAQVRASGGALEVFDAYPGDGHLFSDASLPAEYDGESAELMWSRVLAFLERLD